MLSENVLSRSEKEVLSVIYDNKEKMSLNGILELVNKKYNHTWKPQTVSTFLCRAVKKGYLKSYREGHHIFYVPSIEWCTALKNDLMNFTYMYFDGDIDKMKEFINTELQINE